MTRRVSLASSPRVFDLLVELWPRVVADPAVDGLQGRLRGHAGNLTVQINILGCNIISKALLRNKVTCFFSHILYFDRTF